MRMAKTRAGQCVESSGPDAEADLQVHFFQQCAKNIIYLQHILLLKMCCALQKL